MLAKESAGNFSALQNPGVVAQWVLALPPGEMRDNALSQTPLCMEDEPDTALASAATILDAKLRIQEAQAIYSAWRVLGEDRAAELLRSAPLSPKEKQQIVEGPTNAN